VADKVWNNVEDVTDALEQIQKRDAAAEASTGDEEGEKFEDEDDDFSDADDEDDDLFDDEDDEDDLGEEEEHGDEDSTPLR
jgi:hypothetical protein